MARASYVKPAWSIPISPRAAEAVKFLRESPVPAAWAALQVFQMRAVGALPVATRALPGSRRWAMLAWSRVSCVSR